VTFKRVEAESAHCRSSSASSLAASLVLHVRTPCSRVAEYRILETEAGCTFLGVVNLSV
jgi:hypothetical protein